MHNRCQSTIQPCSTPYSIQRALETTPFSHSFRRSLETTPFSHSFRRSKLAEPPLEEPYSWSEHLFPLHSFRRSLETTPFSHSFRRSKLAEPPPEEPYSWSGHLFPLHSFRRSLETTPFSHSFRRSKLAEPPLEEPYSWSFATTAAFHAINCRCGNTFMPPPVSDSLNNIVPSETHHNGTVFRILLPLRYGPPRHTCSSGSLNGILHPYPFHNGRISRDSLPLRHHVLHCIQSSHNRHSPLPQSLLSTHLHNLLIIHSLSQEPFYRLISCIAHSSLHTAYISTYTSLHLTVCKAQKEIIH